MLVMSLFENFTLLKFKPKLDGDTVLMIFGSTLLIKLIEAESIAFANVCLHLQADYLRKIIELFNLNNGRHSLNCRTC